MKYGIHDYLIGNDYKNKIYGTIYKITIKKEKT
jgi:hypothetical protein